MTSFVLKVNVWPPPTALQEETPQFFRSDCPGKGQNPCLEVERWNVIRVASSTRKSVKTSQMAKKTSSGPFFGQDARIGVPVASSGVPAAFQRRSSGVPAAFQRRSSGVQRRSSGVQRRSAAFSGVQRRCSGTSCDVVQIARVFGVVVLAISSLSGALGAGWQGVCPARQGFFCPKPGFCGGFQLQNGVWTRKLENSVLTAMSEEISPIWCFLLRSVVG